MDELKLRILKLCKRLDRFTFDDIQTIVDDIEPEVLELLLETLISEKKLIRQNGIYLYSKEKSVHLLKSRLPLVFQYYSNDIINLILKCFCAEIPVLKVELIIEPNKNTILKFYNYFRKCLYETQFDKLKKYYEETPKIPSKRALYNKKIYFYNYNNEIFLTDNPLQTQNPEKHHLKTEMRDMNVAYYKIRRELQNYAYTQQLPEIAYEKLWMQGKTQEEKIGILKRLLNISS